MIKNVLFLNREVFKRNNFVYNKRNILYYCNKRNIIVNNNITKLIRKNIRYFNIKNIKKNKTNNYNSENEDVVLINGKVQYINKKKKDNKNELKVNNSFKKLKSIEHLQKLYNEKPNGNLNKTEINKKNQTNEIHKLDNCEIKSLKLKDIKSEKIINNTFPNNLKKKIDNNNNNKTDKIDNIKKENQEKNNNEIKYEYNNINNIPPFSNNSKFTKTKEDVFEILNEIKCNNDKNEIKQFLNNVVMYKNKSSSNILGNIISFYFCNLLSEDLKNLKTYYYDGIKLSVTTFFNTIKELDENQLTKMTNIYLKNYFIKIFNIFKSNNLNISFDNLQINNIKLLQIYNILGLIRKNEGERKKKDTDIKRFLYQHINVDQKNIILLRNNEKMKFLTNILKNGVTTRMHALVNISYELCTINTISLNILTKTKFKNIDLELIFENELTNPYFSLNSYDTVNLKASGWYLVDVNNILNGNLPYE